MSYKSNIISVVILIVITIFIGLKLSNSFLNKNTSIIEKSIFNSISQAKSDVESIENEILKGNYNFQNLSVNNDFDLFIYKRSELVFWSSNNYSIPSKDIFFNTQPSSVFYNDKGVFYLVKKDVLNHTILLSIPFYRHYLLDNKFVKSGLHTNLFKGITGVIVKDNEVNSVLINLENNQSLNLIIKLWYYTEYQIWAFSLILFILISGYLLFFDKRVNLYMKVLILLVLRFSLYFVNFENSQNALFDPSVFA